MSAGSGFRNRLQGAKPIRVTPLSTLAMTRDEVEALHLETEAALREWDDEDAQTLFSIVEAEQVPESGTAP